MGINTSNNRLPSAIEFRYWKLGVTEYRRGVRNDVLVTDKLLSGGNWGGAKNVGWEEVKTVTDPETSQDFTQFYRTFLDRIDIDNDTPEVHFDDCHAGQDLWSKYYTRGFVCPSPMDSTINRRAFPHIYKFGPYSFLAFNAGNSHSVNALTPHVLEFARSDDNWETQELLRIECINDSGTMREIEPLTEGYFPWNYQFAYAGGKIWAIISTFLLTVNPPANATDYNNNKTYISTSSDWGDTWSTLIELDADTYIPISKPIIVGNEIWITSYSVTGVIATQHSYILRYNFNTSTVGTKTRIDTTWTDLSSSEPCILEYASGKFMCVARITWNDNFPGNELIHRGSVIAYSTDGLDWSDYTFYDEGTAYPNQPHLFKYDGYVYFSRGASVLQGTVDEGRSQINWLEKITGQSPWYQNYIYNFRSFYLIDFERYDPRTGEQDQLRQLNITGSVDFVVLDWENEIIGAALSYVLDGNTKIGEPWVAVIKKNTVGAGENYTERHIYAAEIPGDYNDSDEIKLYNFFANSGSTVTAKWLDVVNKPTCAITTVPETNLITFTAAEAVTNAKLVYEI